LLKEYGTVEVEVYNTAGQKIKKLLPGIYRQAIIPFH
jgi:hypothetical protein